MSTRSSERKHVLCVCDAGVGRSVNVAHLLKFMGYDALPVGVDTSEPDTLQVLEKWADVIVLTDGRQARAFGKEANLRVWPIPDGLERPFNAELNGIVRGYIARRDF